MVDQSTLVRLRDRVKELEQQLKAVQGASDVWKSKAGNAAEREKFLLDEDMRASEEMLCEQPRIPRVLVFVFILI